MKAQHLSMEQRRDEIAEILARGAQRWLARQRVLSAASALASTPDQAAEQDHDGAAQL